MRPDPIRIWVEPARRCYTAGWPRCAWLVRCGSKPYMPARERSRSPMPNPVDLFDDWGPELDWNAQISGENLRRARDGR